MSLFFDDVLRENATALDNMEEAFTDEYMEEIPVIESYEEDPVDAISRITFESVENYYNIMHAIALDELACLESTGEELVYEAGRIKAMADKFVAWIKQTFAKVKGAILNAMNKIETFIKADNPWINKLKEKAKSANATPKEFKGYKFTCSKSVYMGLYDKISLGTMDKVNGSRITSLSKSACDSLTKDWKSKEATAKVMGSVFGKDKLDSKEFNKELFKVFRNGKSEKEIISLNVLEAVSRMSDVIKKKNDIKGCSASVQKQYKDMLNKAESIKKIKEDTKEDKDLENARLKVVRILQESIKVKINVVNTITKEVLRATMSEYKQAKAFAKACVSEGKSSEKGKAKNEGAGFLESVELI